MEAGEHKSKKRFAEHLRKLNILPKIIGIVGNFIVYTGYFLAVVIMLLGVYFAVRQHELVIGAVCLIAGIIMAYLFLMRRPEY
ncbi:MAG: hypothetical protein QXU48_04245 [Thermoplasmata archaeon]